MKLSILHISDLHRDPDNPISNDALLNSLIQDISKAVSEEPSIPLPDMIIISGDVIHGTGKDTENSTDVLNEQYAQAEDFLSRLCVEIVGGEREKVVIVPGNHDINFECMFSALQEIDYNDKTDDIKRELADGIWKEQSPYRWSWSDFKLYEIVDQDKYDQRLAEFMVFYDRFYMGNRQYSPDVCNQFDTFHYPDFNLAITGLNSCFRNDPWNRTGIIHPQAFANACRELRHRKYRGQLRLAVWHHSTRGAPREDDYLDSDFLQHLVAHGYSLGFHGHQHKPELIDEHYAFGGESKVNALSASTLAAGPKALSPGGTRGYNRVVVDTDTWKVELHIRQMVNTDFLSPLWGCGNLPNRKSREEFELQKPLPVDPLSVLTQDLSECLNLIQEKQFTDAIAILEPLSQHNDTAKRLLLDALVEKSDNSGIIRHFSQPVSPEEMIAVMSALWEEGKWDVLISLLDQEAVRDNDDPSVAHIREKYMARFS